MAWRKFILLGVGVFVLTGAAAAIGSAPVGFFIPENARGSVPDASGTIWRGRTALNGGLMADHRLAPIRSLTSGRLAFDIVLTGPRTDARLQAGLRPRSVRLTDITGQSDLADMSALAPDLALACEGGARLGLSLVELSPGAIDLTGGIDFTPGVCRTGAEPLAYPAMRLTAEGASAQLVSDAAGPLAHFDVEDGLARMTMTQDGADILAPGRAGPFTVEITL